MPYWLWPNQCNPCDPCDPGGPGECFEGKENCTDVENIDFEVAVAGVTAEAPFNCDVNKTFILDSRSPCIWFSDEPDDHTFPPGNVELGFVFGKWRLELVGYAIYELSTDLDCVGPNVFDFISKFGCNNWPSTLTVEAV